VSAGYDYHRPTTLAAAWELAAAVPGARWIAGGTDLMVRIREGRAKPSRVVSLNAIPELSRIDPGPPIRIGALARVADVMADPTVREALPVLVEAARTLGSAQIRNAATVGGNLCNASPCADTAPPLLVHDARARIASPRGSREVPLEGFFVAPGRTRLAKDELLTDIVVDPPPPGTRAAFLKKGRVRMDIAVASVCVALVVEGGRCTHARVAAGSVAPRPMRLHRTERLLEGAVPSPEVIRAASTTAREEVEPVDDVRSTAAYRRQVVGVFLRRAVERLIPDGGGAP